MFTLCIIVVMSDDAARFRKQAEECQGAGSKALSPLDKEAWLRLAEEWLKLASSLMGDASSKAAPVGAVGQKKRPQHRGRLRPKFTQRVPGRPGTGVVSSSQRATRPVCGGGRQGRVFRHEVRIVSIRPYRSLAARGLVGEPTCVVRKSSCVGPLPKVDAPAGFRRRRSPTSFRRPQ
jgi:hypothetical protein